MTYERELVERLLPAVWDPMAVHGIANPFAPDKDMPKAKANPKMSNTLYAQLADIHQAWRYAPNNLTDRRALYLHYALGWTQKEIGGYFGVSHQAISTCLVNGVGRMMTWLNGDEIDED